MTKRESDALYEELCCDQQKVDKYKKPGIYCITINSMIVYIGKSSDMLYRIAQHILEIEDGANSKSHKYRVLHEAYNRADCKVGFDVMYVSDALSQGEMFRDIGNKEAVAINELRPPLNYQIPVIGDYKHFTVNRQAKYVTLNQILVPQKPVWNF